ncbi:type II toxin-antitoxin system RelE/ParE family toxin [Sulfurovum sp. bin170]|uniref:type II toxin-antitoxin system RelE/ParE family toxin n=1 Tax=Sulfurovum sp. bin170 TaxID=2695268 RepID=UPI0013DE85E8|nr:type II toxin-antitoxin system RelE/ParE family toxin [Sulfurovum sp. bin170]NEW59882.1 type II toxin-antitoxin system RelE/ParE family toxin [Sulfurovum sp. bin170]
MILEISELAQLEIEDSKSYYNLQQKNLGDRFKKHIQDSIDNIIKSPTLYPKITPQLHRVVVHKFPYNIFYALLDDTIIIVSVAHQHREPFYEI